MQRYVSSMALALALLAGACSFQSFAFGFPPKANKPVKAKVRRVPPHFAKVDLTEEQRTKIFEVQDKYKDQIEALNTQLKELRAKEDKEIEEVLNPEQKAKLLAIAEELKKARADKKAAAKVEKKAEPKKEEPKK